MKPNLLLYHPIRYEYILWERLNSVISEYNNNHVERKKYGGLWLLSLIENNLEKMIEEFSDRIPFGMDKKSWSQYKGELLGSYFDYTQAGENIFHLQPELFFMFQQTDVSQVKIDELQLPYNAIYLYFGDSKEFDVGFKKYIDGAYIYNDYKENLIFIYLTTRNLSLNYESENFTELDLINSENHLYYLLVGEDGSVGKSMEDVFLTGGGEYYNRAQFEQWKPHLRKVTNTIINTLCFMNSEHNDTVIRFTNNCPSSFSEKYEKAITEKQRERISSKAQSQGFRRVKFIGDSYQSLNSNEKNTDKTLSPHWRRGHWRHQPYGKNREQQKLVWIKPTIVNKQHGNPTIKHIYDVE